MKVDLQFNCPKNWDSMEGNDQARHCSNCDKKVHNLSELSLEEANGLISNGDSCVTMRVNQRGEIRTASGFSKSLLLMGLAIGCGGDPIADEKKTSVTITGTDSKIVEQEVIGDVAEYHPDDDATAVDCESTKSAVNTDTPDCDSTTTKSTTNTNTASPSDKNLEPKRPDRPMTGRVAPHSHHNKDTFKNKGKKSGDKPTKKEPPITN
jgi:hypothetical protein